MSGTEFGGELLLRLHDRRSSKWGKLDFIGPGDDLTTGRKLFDVVERMPDGTVLDVIKLKQSMVPWIAWALEAPSFKNGPK